MENLNSRKKMLIISSYPPRQCGIATFTEDIIHSIATVFGDSLPIEVCALESNHNHFNYPNEVSYVLQTSELEEYRNLADKINARTDIGLVCIQHEFGLFGGEYGDYLLSFLLALSKPIITVFHTVLPFPDEKRLKNVQAIGDLSNRIIVLTNRSKEILIDRYGYQNSKIGVIPHGTHIVLWEEKEINKYQFGYKDNIILSNFGLLSENKGIETVLYALPDIVEKYPEVLFLVIGKTHPEVVKREGEKYRNKLKNIIKESKLEKHVVFIDEYLALDQLLKYISLSDIYLFSSKDPHQAVSGTFAYAMSGGCPIISTPIPHAVECIKDSGILLEKFDEPKEFRDALLQLIENKELRIEMGRRGYIATHASTWENIAIQYALIFGELTNKMEELRFNFPPIKLDHIINMTTKIGMLQFSKLSEPDVEFGYTLDDNARALVYIVKYHCFNRDCTSLKLAYTYLAFIENMQSGNADFKNYIDYNGNFTSQNEESNLDDAYGRVFWSLGYVLSKRKILPLDFVLRAEILWEKSISWIREINSPRAIAYILKGLYKYHKVHPEEYIKELTVELSNKLLNYYHVSAKANWHWYEDYVSYANNILPEAMMYGYLVTDNKEYKKIAEVTFDFLLSHYFMKGQIKVVSKKGWFKKKNEREFYGEQPIEVVSTIVTLDLFYEVTGNQKYKNQLEVAFSWFLGNNHLNQIMYNTKNGASYDGLEDKEVNINQGAESALCFFNAQMIMEKYLNNQSVHKTKVAPNKRLFESELQLNNYLLSQNHKQAKEWEQDVEAK